jgi:hypothetical protein
MINWISVKNEMPTDQEKVVVLLGEINGYDYTGEAVYRKGEFVEQTGKRIEVEFWRRKNYYEELWKS